MKQCLSCNIEVGGKMETCPLCQNMLTGDETPYNWPTMTNLKKKAFLYKIQLFIVLAIAVVALSLDFLLDLNGEGSKHWGLVLAVVAVLVEVILKRYLNKNFVLAKVINFSILYATMILVFISWYYDFLNPIIYVVVPIIMGATLIANLTFSLIDKSGNAMVYLLCNILVGALSYIVLVISHRKNLPWTICLMISAVTLIGIIVFKGRTVRSEIAKRMNI